MASVVRHHKFNFLVIGDTMTGKTALVRRYVKGTFKKDNDSTIGIEYEGKSIVGHPKCEAELRLGLWDTAGQKIFKELIKGYFKSGDGIVIVVDLTKRSSYKGLGYWLKQCDGLMRKMTPVMVIGNKLDVARGEKREITEEEMMKFVGKYNNMEYIEASALSGKNVSKAFENLIVRVLDKMRAIDDRKSVDFRRLETELRNKRGNGCGKWIKRFFCCFG